MSNFFMKKIYFFFLLTWISLYSCEISSLEECQALPNWLSGQSIVLSQMKMKSSRTAVLIIAPPQMNNSPTEQRWKLGKKVWEQYMNSVSSVDCFFIQYTYRKNVDKPENVWREGNTIFVADEEFEKEGRDRILHKTIVAIEFLLPEYSHFIRTNLNTFFNLYSVDNYTKTHRQSMYTGPLWQGEWYLLGYGVLFTKDVAAHIVKEYRRLEGLDIVSCNRADDCVLTSLATGIYPFDPSEHLFCCCPSLPLGVRQLMCQESLSTRRLSKYGVLLLPPITLNKAKQFCRKASSSMMMYRIREGLTLLELADFYQFLLEKIYRNSDVIDLKEYVRSFEEN